MKTLQARSMSATLFLFIVDKQVIPVRMRNPQKNRREPNAVRSDMEQVTGLEPVISAWKANVLPLHYTCIRAFHAAFDLERETGLSAQSSCRLRSALRGFGLSLPGPCKQSTGLFASRGFEPL